MDISKLDAAKRQLDMALKLFFLYADVVAIHTVASASFGILEDLCKKQGVDSLTQKGLLGMIKPEKQAEVSKKLRAAQNFFKHADRDSDQILHFNPVITEFILMDAAYLYQMLTNEKTALMVIYDLWYFSKNSDLLLDSIQRKMYENISEVVNHRERGKFFELLPEIEKKLLGAS